jgi:hypothetical protein
MFAQGTVNPCRARPAASLAARRNSRQKLQIAAAAAAPVSVYPLALAEACMSRWANCRWAAPPPDLLLLHSNSGGGHSQARRSQREGQNRSAGCLGLHWRGVRPHPGPAPHLQSDGAHWGPPSWQGQALAMCLGLGLCWPSVWVWVCPVRRPIVQGGWLAREAPFLLAHSRIYWEVLVGLPTAFTRVASLCLSLQAVAG